MDSDVSELAVARTEIDQLRSALHSRLVIGRAEGILMERLGLDADQAFDYLKRLSSTSNRKVVDIAANIAETGELPAMDG